MDKFTNIDGQIYHKGIYMGSFIDINQKTFTQFSNEGVLFDIELSKEFMRTKTDKELVVERGHSTKTQQWFTIKEKL